MKTRVISMLLVVCMVCSLLPVPVLAADETTSESTSSVDDFGVRMEGALEGDEKAEVMANNPYGTENWINLFPISELNVSFGDNEGFHHKTYDFNPDYNSPDPDERVGSIGAINPKSSTSGIDYSNPNAAYTYMDTAACDPSGEGKSDHVVNLVYKYDSEDKTNKIIIYLTDRYGYMVSNAMTVGNSSALEYLRKTEQFYRNGFFSVACGDFDGDGIDSIVAYSPELGENRDATLWHFEITEKSNGEFTIKSGKNSMNIYNITGYEHAKTNSDSAVRDVPLVSLLAEDTDKDGVDELIMTASRSDAQEVEARGSVLCVFDYIKNASGSYSFSRSAYMELCTDTLATAGRLRWASSSVGNVISDTSTLDFPEIITAGFYDYKGGTERGLTNKENPSNGNFAAYMASCTEVEKDENGNQIGTYAMNIENLPINASSFVRGGYDKDTWKQGLVQVQAFSAKGITQPDYVLVADTVYSYEDGQLKQQYQALGGDDDYVENRRVTKANVNDVVAGNFDGNTDGVEQVVLTQVQKRQYLDNYFTRVYTYQLKDGKWQCDTTGWFSHDKDNAFVSLTAFDYDNDGTIARLKDVERNYTEPEVLAILEAVPYFAEVDGGDINNGETSYETTESTSEVDSSSNTLNTNIITGFEWSVDDLTAGFACGAGIEATVENNFTWSTEKEKTESYSLTRSNDTGENMVIVYRRPVLTYQYELKNSSKDIMISKEGQLATSMIPVDDFNKIAEQNKIDTINDSLLGTPGDPFSYRSVAPEGATFKDEQYQQYYNPAGGTFSQSFTTGDSTTKSFEYELNTSFTAYGIFMGVKAGGGGGYAHTDGHSTINTKDIAKTGTVSCNSTEGYDFQWRFGHWDTEINGNTVPVLGYVVVDQIAPPSTAMNLSSDKLTSNSFELSWEAGNRPAEEYRIYRDMSDDGLEPVQVAVVDGTKTSCDIEGLYANKTYKYIIKGYTAPGEGVRNSGLSVASEQIIISTLPENAEAPTISGPDDVEARVGSTAKFTVNVVLPTMYTSQNFKWQQRTENSVWEDVPQSKDSRTLTLTNVTEEMDDMQIRCVISANASDGTPTYFYSDIASLKVGSMSVNAGLAIRNADSGTGDISDPYTGKANYSKQTDTTKTEDIIEVPVVFAATDGIPELALYKDNSDTYVGIGENVYYEVTKTGDTYTVGDELTLQEYAYYDEDGDEYTTMPSFENKQISTESGGKYYYLASDIETQYWFDGTNYYEYISNSEVGDKVSTAPEDAYDVYLNGIEGTVLGRGEGTGDDEGSYWYYHVKISGKTVTKTRVSQKSVRELSNGISLSELEAVTEEEIITTETPVYEVKDGTELILTASITDTDGNSASGATVAFRIVNTTTGAPCIISDKTSANGEINTKWIAATSGLYSVTATVQRTGDYASASSVTQYYFAGETPKNDNSITEYKLELSKDGNKIAGELVYAPDTSIGMALQSRTVGETTSAWETPSDSIVYTLTAPDGTTKNVSGSAFTPDRAGQFTVKAYKNAVAIENLVATASLQINRDTITIEPSWAEDTTPESIDGFTAVATDNEAAKLDGVFDVICDLYNADGTIRDKTGRFTVSLEYKNNDEMVKFNNCYQVTLLKKDLIVEPNTAPVYYSCGENGTLNASYTEQSFTLPSGYPISAGTFLQFIARPNSGYQIDEWIINNEAKSADELKALGYEVYENVLIMPDFKAPSSGLKVEVTFESTNNKVTFSCDGEGTVTAISGTDTPFESETSVALGTDITFTAKPATAMVVEKWLVDGKTYTWAGTDETYRGNTLKLEDINKDHIVVVYFTDDESYNITTSVYAEDGTADAKLATISAVDADNGANVDLGEPISCATALTFTANLTNSASNTVKEWQYKKSTDSAFITVAGSGGQNSVTLYNLTADTEVRAIVTSAQSFDLNFEIIKDGTVYTGDMAALTATSNGVTVTAGAQPAYIPVDFELELDDSYYVVEWSNNVTANSEDKLSAKLDTLLATTGDITVIVAEKPQVTVADSADGTTTVSSKLMDKSQVIAETETKHVDYDTTISVIANPDDGYYVDSISVDETTIYNEVKTNYDAGTITKTIADEITADTTITVVYAKKPVITFAGDDNMTVTAKDVANTGDFVEKYSDGIIFTATPEAGYEMNAWTVNDTAITPTTNTKNDDTTYTSAEVTADIAVSVTSKAIPQFEISYAVVDTQNTTDGGDGFNGEVSLKSSRKEISAYDVTGTAATNATAEIQEIYRDSEVTLTAIPDAGYRVKHWLLAGEVYEENGATHKGVELIFENLNAEKAVQVEFEKITDQTSIEAINGTIVSAKVAGTDVDVTGFKLSNNATVEIVAEANEGYLLKHWVVNGNVQSETGLTFSYTSNSDSDGSHIEAIFESDSHALTYSAGANGNVETDIGATGTLVKEGTVVTFTATPDENYGVKCWKVDGVAQTEASNEFTLTVTDAVDVTVEFERTHYIVSFDEESMTAKVDDSSISTGDAVKKGSDVVFTAILKDNYIVQNWTENTTTDGGSEANPCENNTYTVSDLNADTTVGITTIAMPSYTVTYSSDEKGSIALSGNEISPATVERHSELSFSATPDAYYQVDAWTINGEEVTANTVGTEITRVDGVATLKIADVTEDMTVTVLFKEAVRYNVKFSTDITGVEGSISATADGEGISYTGTSGIDVIGGSKLVFTATPEIGNMVEAWTVNGEVQDNLSNTLELDLETSVDLVVKFEEYKGYTIPVSTDDYTISDVVRTPDDTEPTTEIRDGGDVTFTVTPVEGHITNLDVTGGTVATTDNEDGSKTITISDVNEDITLNVTIQIGALVTITCGDNGAVTVLNGEISVATNSVVTADTELVITAIPNSGYKLNSLKVNDVIFKSGETYTVLEADETVAIVASFKAVSTGGGGGVSAPEEEEPEILTHESYVGGYPDGTFNPQGELTRAEALTIFANLMEDPEMDEDETYENSFPDVTENLWYYNTVGFMQDYNIITGYTDGTFGGGDDITRAEFAAIAVRYNELVLDAKDTDFEDVEGHWAEKYIAAAVEEEWIKGYDDGTFLPDQTITRAEAVTMINRMLERTADEKYVDENVTKLNPFSDIDDKHWAYYDVIEAAISHMLYMEDELEVWTELVKDEK